jgi:hypothetical protein
MSETIEGTAVEVEPRALVVTQPGNALIARPQDGPADMIEHATRLATALKDIVERQKLYTVISGKKFPQVEAWMTIGRMDNVVAREAERPIRNEDGSYEGFVELVRLSDGMVIGRASALCGTPDDNPWAKRGEPARRSMAVTRATSRAFRQQYSWIMALAGYMPTPAEEMPHQPDAPEKPSSVVVDRGNGGLIGIASIGTASPVDGAVRQTPDGMCVGFVIGEGREKVQVVAYGPRAEAFALVLPTIVGKRVQVFGPISMETMRVGKFDREFQRVRLQKLVTPDETVDFTEPEPPVEVETVPLFDEDEQARIDDALAAVG